MAMRLDALKPMSVLRPIKATVSEKKCASESCKYGILSDTSGESFLQSETIASHACHRFYDTFACFRCLRLARRSLLQPSGKVQSCTAFLLLLLYFIVECRNAYYNL